MSLRQQTISVVRIENGDEVVHTFSVGEYVKVWLSSQTVGEPHVFYGTVTSVGPKSRTVRVLPERSLRGRSIQYAVARIYKTEQPVAPKPVGMGRLSKVVRRVNVKNEPPGGWGDEDKVS